MLTTLARDRVRRVGGGRRAREASVRRRVSRDARVSSRRAFDMRGDARSTRGVRAHVSCALALALALALARSARAWGLKKDGNQPLGGDASFASVPHRVCFIAASVPWAFGAYQAQALGLSRAFADRGHSTTWLPRIPDVRLPSGERTLDEALEKLKPSVRRPTASERAVLTHLTFLGIPDVETPAGHGINELGLTMSQLGEVAKRHRVDAFVLLMDVGQMYVDRYAFAVPTVLWMPYHYEGLDASGGVVGAYSAVAALSETTRRAIAIAQPLTRTIPHFIDRASLHALADAHDARARENLGLSEAEATRRAIRRYTFDSKKYDRMYARAIDEVDDDTFVVLMQGGNYENSDRKGWVASINAFARFQRENPTIKTHLWLHCVDSAMTQNDMNHGSKPPVAVARTGVSLRTELQKAGIPESMFTLDENIHDEYRASALKRHADVCLHTSKSEGFGMVVLECQALGTPVITTNYTAMRDYTKFGIAVEPAALERIQGAYFAMPNVPKAAEALAAIATNSANLPGIDGVYEWIDDELSLDVVCEKFRALLRDAKVAHSKVAPWSEKDSFAQRPIFTVTTDEYPRIADWQTPWTMYHHPSVQVDYDLIQRYLIRATSERFYAVALAPTTRDGVALPFDPKDGVHNINPLYVALLPTWIFRQLQEGQSYVWSAVYSGMQTVRDSKYFLMMPEGGASLKRGSGNAHRVEL